jgi:ATP-dependent exoDNAse (exonuclease V) beta subunit
MSEEFREDPFQREAIHCQSNAVVSAGAGSGKTRVLAERFAWLVESGVPSDRILALTFTRKAAAEIYQRVFRTLEARALREALAALDGTNVSTLDSFASRVFRAYAPQAGFTPDFQLDDARRTRIARDQALALLMERQDDPFVRALVAERGFEPAWTGLLADAVREGSPAEPIDYVGDESRQAARIRELLSSAEREARELLEIAARANLRGAAPGILELGDYAKGAPRPEDGPLALADYLAMAPRKPRAPGRGEDIAQIEAAIEAFVRARALQDTILSCLAASESEGWARGLAALLAELQVRFHAALRASSTLGFRDVALYAREALLRDAELRAHYKARYDRIMVDEFQDNNSLQRDCLFLISERAGLSADRVPGPEDLDDGKLMFVGDEKQSIYRFRGADVSVFRELEEELSRCAPRPGLRLSLRNNYRSAPALVAFHNRAFEALFSQAQSRFDARHEEALPGLADSASGVLVLTYEEAKGADRSAILSPLEREAREIADRISRWVAEGSLAVGQAGKERPAIFGDFAILARSRASLAAAEAALSRAQVPCASRGGTATSAEAVFSDFRAALRLALQPADSYAFAAFLRSPFTAVPDSLSCAVLAARRGREREARAQGMAAAAPLTAFEDGLDALDPAFAPDAAALAAWEAAGARLRELRRRLEAEPLPRALDWLWDEAGYRLAVLSDPAQRRFLSHFAQLRALAAQVYDSGGDAAELLAAIDAARDEEGGPLAELELPSDDTRAVKLLTVHKSKGLEFPVVIVMDCYRSPSGRVGAKPFYQSREYGLCANHVLTRAEKARFKKAPTATNPIYEDEKALDAKQAEAEARRLLYVAMTRAESRLILSGSRGARRGGGPKSFFELLGPQELAASGAELETFDPMTREEATGRDAARHASPGHEAPRREAKEAEAAYAQARVLAFAEPRSRLPVTALNPERDYLSDAPRPRQEGLARLPIDALIEAEPPMAAAFGTLCHALLARSLAPRKSRRAAAAAWDTALGAFPDDASRKAAEESAQALAQGFLDSELGHSAMKSERRETELAFSLGLGTGSNSRLGQGSSGVLALGGILSLGGILALDGSIDLAFEGPEGIVVVDYKTDRTAEPADYAPQMEAYRRAALAIFGKPCQAFLFYLRTGKAVPAPSGADLGKLAKEHLDAAAQYRD